MKNSINERSEVYLTIHQQISTRKKPVSRKFQCKKDFLPYKYFAGLDRK